MHKTLYAVILFKVYGYGVYPPCGSWGLYPFALFFFSWFSFFTHV